VSEITETVSKQIANERSQDESGKLVEVETKERSKVSLGVYAEYLRSAGFTRLLIAFIVAILGLAIFFVLDWVSVKWAAADPHDQAREIWIWSVVGMTVAGGILTGIGAVLLLSFMMSGSTRLFEKMLRSVLASPLQFFHVNPIGRIVNRFTSDLAKQDEEVPICMNNIVIV